LKSRIIKSFLRNKSYFLFFYLSSVPTGSRRKAVPDAGHLVLKKRQNEAAAFCRAIAAPGGFRIRWRLNVEYQKISTMSSSFRAERHAGMRLMA
jgi:hypothetical protein